MAAEPPRTAPDPDPEAPPVVPSASPARTSMAQRWLARLSLVCAAAAVLLPLVEGRRSIPLVVVGVLGLGLFLVGVWWAASRRGLRRLAGLAVAVTAPLVVLVMYLAADLLWLPILGLALAGGAVFAGRAALTRDPGPGAMPEHPARPARQPFLIMNPRSGGAKVERFDLERKAKALGAQVALLSGPGEVDVAQLARSAVAAGADLLGVAGGDGTQALVAGVAAEHDLPLLVISAGTRNHFALDLGLDRQDPSTCLDALVDGVDLRVDLGAINGRPFVNNASFGAYAAIVQSPAYRDDKLGTTLELLPDLLAEESDSRLTVRAGEVAVEGPQALLVSNNPYGMGDLAGLGRRPRLDRGVLGMVALRVGSAAHAAMLLRRRHNRGLTVTAAGEVVVEADTSPIPVGVDGEALLLPVPVRCTVRPGVLRVRVPRNRPGVPPAKPHLDWRRLYRLAVAVG